MGEEVIADGEELMECPHCGEPLKSGHFKPFGEIILRPIYCPTTACDFRATEEFVIDKTVVHTEDKEES